MIHRICKPLLSNSFFLFGARAVGKTTLINALFQDKKTLTFDLLKPEVEEEYSLHPERFREIILSKLGSLDWVIVDEVQRVPKLLNSVHSLIESHKVKFAITGSSARKLRHGAANLLAGRAFLNYLYPLTSIELKQDFSLNDVLQWGSLPKVFQIANENEKVEYLKSYVLTFVQEEIRTEQLVRNLDPFRRFLEVAAQTHGKILNYSNVAFDVGVEVKTVQNYYQILDDTLIGFFLEPHHTSVRKTVSQKPKFFFFDIGVQRALAKQLTMKPTEESYLYGDLFESFFILECVRLNQYYSKDYQFSYLRTKDDVEIDLIIKRPGKPMALIEIKSSKHINERKLAKFSRLAADFKNAEVFCASRERVGLKIGSVRVLPWQELLAELFYTAAGGT